MLSSMLKCDAKNAPADSLVKPNRAVCWLESTTVKFNGSRRKLSRTPRWLAAFLLLLGCCLSLPAREAQAQREIDPNEPTPAELVTPQTERAIKRGLAYLNRRQIKSGRDKGSFGRSGYSAGVAVCGLSGLAFMCSGSAPSEGPYGRNIEDCVDFLIANSADTGYISLKNGAGNDNMYGHGFATLFLAEAYGMSHRPELEMTLQRSIDLIIRCQNEQGGWRYQPVKSDADLSITICQIMALRAARDAGIDVPDKTREKCIDYVRKSQNSDGGFRYTLGSSGSTFALTSAGVVSLYSAGIYDDDGIDKALKYIENYKPGRSSQGSYYFYSHYYACQAMWHAGGDHWEEWYPAIREELLKNQQADGSWNDSQVGPEFGTAMACIILQMPLNYVPVFAP